MLKDAKIKKNFSSELRDGEIYGISSEFIIEKE